MIHREIEAEILPYCGKNKIGVVCYSPMAKGILTGKMTAERIASLPADDHRRNDPDFQGETFKAHLKLVEACGLSRSGAARRLHSFRLRGCCGKEVTSAIAGARSPQQIEETAKAGDWKLSADDIAEIEELIEQHMTWAISKLHISNLNIGRTMEDNKIYTSPLVERNASKEMAELFGPQTKFELWRRIWLELAKAEKKLGLRYQAEPDRRDGKAS